MKIIYSSDNHITLDAPICRTDDFVETLRNKLIWLKDLIKKHNAVFLNGGDIADVSRYSSPNKTIEWLRFMFSNFPECYFVYGNHTLPHHRLDYRDKSVIAPLVSAGVCNPIDEPVEITDNVWVHGFHFGQEIAPFDESLYPEDSKHIAVIHAYVYKEDTSMIAGYNAKQLLYDNPQYDMILSGDHHSPFTVTLDDQVLINSGPLYRGSIDKINLKPVVWIIDTDDMSYEAIPVPIIDGVISTEHKDKVTHKTNTMESVVNVVKNSESVVLSFDTELESIIAENQDLVDNHVREYIDIVTEKEETYSRS